jgi:hypothetical protein
VIESWASFPNFRFGLPRALPKKLLGVMEANMARIGWLKHESRNHFFAVLLVVFAVLIGSVSAQKPDEQPENGPPQVGEGCLLRCGDRRARISRGGDGDAAV